MKKSVLLLMLCLFISCDDRDVNDDVSSSTDAYQYKQSTMFNYIESIGVGFLFNNCQNNILIFPTWDKYHETIDALDQMTEQYCDNFDSSVPNGISDEQYDALADAANFDEDDILLKFEEDLEFCSLRQKIEALENSWLEQQGDGDWDMDSDPDNHFIDDETERAFLSQNVEVIIGDKIKGYTYYRFFDDMGTWIELYANNISVLS